MNFRTLQLVSFLLLFYSCNSPQKVTSKNEISTIKKPEDEALPKIDEIQTENEVIPIEVHKVETLQAISEIHFNEKVKISSGSPEIEKPELHYLTKGFLFEMDSMLYHFNSLNKSSTKIYVAGINSTIDKFIHVKKRGLFILERDNHFSRILFKKGLFNSQIDTLLSIKRWGSESVENTICNLNVSPTGDYMTYKSGGILSILDLETNKIISHLSHSEIGHFNEFIMWVPYNSVLVVSSEGSEINGPGDLHVIHINLENNKYESWMIPDAIYSGHFSPTYLLNQATILCRSDNLEDNTDIKGIKIGPLYELKGYNDSIQFEQKGLSKTVKLELVNSDVINCKMTSSKSLTFDNNYDLTYSHFNSFRLNSIKPDTSNNNIIIDFFVGIDQHNYGRVQYVLNYDGNLIEKKYRNVHEYHMGFDLIQYEHITDSNSNIRNTYKNGYLQKSLALDILPSPIPSKIVYNEVGK